MLGNHVFRKGIVIACILALVTGLGIALFLHFYSANNNSQLPSSQTYGMILVDIFDSETQSTFHVSEPGVYVLAVEEDSPAEKAGILSGDRITHANGQSVGSTEELLTLCVSENQSSSFSLLLIRDQEEMEIQIPLSVSMERRPLYAEAFDC